MTVEAQIINIIGRLRLNKFLLADNKRLDYGKLSKISQTLLMLALLWTLSQLTWQLFTPASNIKFISVVNHNTPVAQKNNPNGRVNLKNIIELNLFGIYRPPVVDVEPEIEPDEAPITSLNLKLMGVVSSSDFNLAAAIIEKSGQQNTYGVGEKVDGTQAVIKEILPDRIILEQRRKRETLMLEGADYTKDTVKPERMKPKRVNSDEAKKRQRKLSANQKASVDKIKEEFFADPGKVSDYIKAAPFKRDGQLVGYTIRPGKKVELFNAFGLRNGDIAIEINGYDLTDLSQAMNAMQELRNATEARLLVERNGEVIETHFSLN